MNLADPAEGPSKIGFAPIVKTVLPDVVNISTSKVVKEASSQEQFEMPDGMPPFFQQFFGQQFGPRSSSSAPFKEIARHGSVTSAKTASGPASS